MDKTSQGAGMKLGVLFSGGKDSTYAMAKAMEQNKIVCLISIISKNKESYMFHTPNIDITKLQAEAIGIPMVRAVTEGVKEEELEDLKCAIKQAKEKYRIEGIVTGAIESVYQSRRIQKICDDLNLVCINPLWKKDQKKLLEELVNSGYDIMISGIFAYPMDERWLGKHLDKKMITELVRLNEKYQISPVGEGGEIETTVLDAPFFKKKIKVNSYEIKAEKNSGILIINDAELAEK